MNHCLDAFYSRILLIAFRTLGLKSKNILWASWDCFSIHWHVQVKRKQNWTFMCNRDGMVKKWDNTRTPGTQSPDPWNPLGSLGPSGIPGIRGPLRTFLIYGTLQNLLRPRESPWDHRHSSGCDAWKGFLGNSNKFFIKISLASTCNW